MSKVSIEEDTHGHTGEQGQQQHTVARLLSKVRAANINREYTNKRLVGMLEQGDNRQSVHRTGAVLNASMISQVFWITSHDLPSPSLSNRAKAAETNNKYVRTCFRQRPFDQMKCNLPSLNSAICSSVSCTASPLAAGAAADLGAICSKTDHKIVNV